MNYNDYLKREMKVAFGCTEPIALAYAAAKAREVLGREPEKIEADLSANMIKNANSVYVPGTEGRKGIAISIAAGALLGDPTKELEVLAHIDKSGLSACDEFIREGRIAVTLKENVANLYIDITAFAGDSYAKVIIAEEHTNIILIEKDHEVLFEKSESTEEEVQIDFSFDEIYDYAKTVDLKDFEALLDQEIEYNAAIAAEGIDNPWGSGIGRLILGAHPDDLREKIVAYTAAGSDARMSGAENPVVINSGSGNQGISISVPLILYAEDKKLPRETLLRGLLFSNLLGLYQKKNIGKLSAFCGVVSAASAAICGIAFMKGDDREVIKETLANALAVNGGILCDGAKASCAMKIASSLRNGFLAYDQAVAGRSFHAKDGVVKEDIDETLEVVGNIARYGMKKTDEVILNEVLGNRDYIKEFE